MAMLCDIVIVACCVMLKEHSIICLVWNIFMLFTQSSITVDPRLSPLGTCVFGFLHGGLVDESLINFMVVGHIPLEVLLPIS